MKVARIIALAAAVAAVSWVAGCDAAGVADGRMTYDELQACIEDAVRSGGSFSLTIDELSADAQVEFIELVGSGRSPEDFSGVAILFEAGSIAGQRALSSFCFSIKYVISHSPGCPANDVHWRRRKVAHDGRCPHTGYIESPLGTQVLAECGNSSCGYESNKRTYYHQRET